jgi:hypothetical protein
VLSADCVKLPSENGQKWPRVKMRNGGVVWMEIYQVEVVGGVVKKAMVYITGHIENIYLHREKVSASKNINMPQKKIT